MGRMDWIRRHIHVSGTGRFVALVLWTLFIWGNSLVPGDASSSESLAFLGLVRPFFEALGITDADLMHTLVRKAAHFSEYAVLGVLAVRALWSDPAWPVVAIGLVAPCVDETIQLFVPDRCGAITDVAIDMCGFVAGVLLVLLARRISHRSAGR